MTAVTIPQPEPAPGTGAVVEAGGKLLALFCIEGRWCAIDNTCAHRGGPLGEGALEGTCVTCPWHGWEYDVTTGACRMDEQIAVVTYPVRVEGDQVVIEVP